MALRMIRLAADDGGKIAAYEWWPAKPRGVVQILHGLSEHGRRYDRLAQALNAAGLAVIAHDHRGHGDLAADVAEQLAKLHAKDLQIEALQVTADPDAPPLPPSKSRALAEAHAQAQTQAMARIYENAAGLGHFGPGGWQQVVNDALRVNRHARERNSQLPLFLLGHSMGSYVAQCAVVSAQAKPTDSDDNAANPVPAPVADGLILSGSNLAKSTPLKLGRALARFESWRQGPSARSALLQRMTFGEYARQIKARHTDYDWLSSDIAEVEAYISDPLCGAPPRNELWTELMGALITISTPGFFGPVPAQLPVLILGGSDDPVGGTKGMWQLAAAFERAGVENVTVNIYPGGRHEMFNEVSRDEVTEHLQVWIDSLLS